MAYRPRLTVQRLSVLGQVDLRHPEALKLSLKAKAETSSRRKDLSRIFPLDLRFRRKVGAARFRLSGVLQETSNLGLGFRVRSVVRRLNPLDPKRKSHLAPSSL